MTDIETPLEDLLAELSSCSDTLCRLLSDERIALVQRDLEELQRIVEAKITTCVKMESLTIALGDRPLSEQISAQPAHTIPQLEQLHKSLKQSSNKTQEYNAVNGKIVQRTQQSLRELFHLISGTDAELLYGNKGQTSATAKGTAIAEA